MALAQVASDSMQSARPPLRGPVWDLAVLHEESENTTLTTRS